MNDFSNDVSPPIRPPAQVVAAAPPAALMRTAITACFALGGFLVASWAVRIPDVSTQVGTTHAALGGALLCVCLGALATMRITGTVCERIGPGLVSAIAAVVLCVALVAPGLVHTVSGLGAALLGFGAATGALNVAINSFGVRLEARVVRPLLPSMHAAFRFGGLGGSVVGRLAASQIDPAPHLLAVAAAGLLCVGAIGRTLVASDLSLRPVRAHCRPRARPTAHRCWVTRSRGRRHSCRGGRARGHCRLHGVRRGSAQRPGSPAPGHGPERGARCHRRRLRELLPCDGVRPTRWSGAAGGAARDPAHGIRRTPGGFWHAPGRAGAHDRSQA